MRKVIATVAALALSALSLFIFVLWTTTDVPSFELVKNSYRISEGRLLDRRGDLIQEVRLSKKDRRVRWDALEQVPSYLVDTVVATEDKRFFSHHGVDWLALCSATYHSIFGSRRGASTISMQVVAIINPSQFGPRKSIWMKVWQIKQALILEHSWTKSQILEAYLNLVSFRGELVGIASASGGLFAKYSQGLTREEGVILASLIRSPQASTKDVSIRACSIAKRLWNDFECEHIEAQVNNALNRAHSMPTEVALAPQVASRLFTDRLASPSQDTVIESTLDASLQRFAIDLLKRKLVPLADRNVHDGAILVVDNATGDVLAYVGNSGPLASRRFVDGVAAKRQAGSTLKPFLYALAFDRKILTAASELEDNPTEFPIFGGLYRPRNYDKQFHGKVSVRTALASSMNVVAVKTLDMLGVDSFLDKLRNIGITQLRDADFYGVSLALGSANVSLWELVNGYRTLANEGLFSNLRLSSIDDNGTFSKAVYSKEAAFIVSDILSDRQSRALAFGLENPLSTPYWSAVKTGTSRDMIDNWCVGFSRRYTVGAWVGNFSGEPMWNVSGVTGAATVWNEIMDFLERDRGSSEQPAMPDNISQKRIDSGLMEYFIRGTEPSGLPINERSADLVRARITYPANDTVFAIDPDIPPGHQLIPIQVSQTQGDFTLSIDGKQILNQDMPYLWPPTPGRHNLSLADKNGSVGHRVAFTVKGY